MSVYKNIDLLPDAETLDGTEQIEVLQGGVNVNSTTNLLIVARLTTAQRDALTAVNGMLIYNTTDDEFQGYQDGAWVTFDTTPI